MPENSISEEFIQAWLVSKLSERLEIGSHEIDIREPLASYGLGSTDAVTLAGELAEWLGRRLSAALVYEYPTIEALARYLAKSPDASRSVAGARLGRASNDAPIAITGIGCRFPGANDPAAFWQLLRDGIDAIGEVPADRFDQHAFYDPDPATPGKMNTRWGGFLGQVDRFDANFFGISPREASRMDPQQRLLLEVTWEALQDSGAIPERLVGSQTGVFIGIATNDYGRLQWNDFERIDAYAGTGNALSIAANRISYTFDFRGPSLAIDTACSSSLVAVHLACRSLRDGESTLALAGGVNLILSPAIAINFTKAGAMASDGRCKTFDARADGYVRAEGAGVVVLKLLSNAVTDGDRIYAVIRGSAVNQDGRSNGLMAPNPLAQEAVLREAYQAAGVSPGQIEYVEAHGTGTLLGDPIEAKALGTVLGIERTAGTKCAVGSVKTNVGHLEAAAGIAGLIKVALALQHREIPPSLHFEKPNPHIPFEELPLRVQTVLGPWPTHTGPALAGVSSFGFGGTNAHVVLEEAPAAVARTQDAERNIAQLLPLSARSPDALQSVARDYIDFLASSESASPLSDICYSASVRLGHHDYRLAVTGNSPAQMTERLEAFLVSEPRLGLSSGRRRSERQRKLVFVFPGQGSQWFGMGRLLLKQESVFRDVIERCDRALRPYGDWSLLDQFAAIDVAHSRLSEIDIVQPVLFSIQIALAALWRSWGIEPHAVVGHSVGEVAAAYVAGALVLDDAVRVVCHRSRLFKRTIGQGAMAAVELSNEAARDVLVGFEDRVSIAASNGPASTVLSGDPRALAAILDRLQRDGIFCRMVNVDFAAHSPQMEPLQADLLQGLEGVRPLVESVPIYSTVTGQIGSGLELDGRYWVKNMRDPVLFSTAVQRLVEDGHDIFMEISPHPILLSAMQQGFHHRGQECAVLPSLRHDEDERTVLLESLGALYALGRNVDWNLIHRTGGRCIQLPLYPWQRERFWLEPATAESSSHRDQGKTSNHPLIDRHFISAHGAGAHFWETTLDRKSLPYLDDHCIEGVAVLPAAIYLKMALAAADEVFGTQSVVLTDIEFRKALFLPKGERRTAQVVLSRGTEEAATFHIYSCAADEVSVGKTWVLHASGKIDLQSDSGVFCPDPRQESLSEMRVRCVETISGPGYYQRLHEIGIHYGPFFQSIAALQRNNGDMLGDVQISEGSQSDANGLQIHPAILDAGLQVFGAAVAMEATENDRLGLYLPTHIDTFRVLGRPGRRLWSHSRIRRREADTSTGDVRLFDEDERVVIEIIGLRFEHVGEGKRHAAVTNLADWLYSFQWQPKELAAQKSTSPVGGASWLIFGDNGGVGDELSALLEARGERSILVVHGDSYERLDGDRYRIRPERPEDIRWLFETALASDQPACRGVVHLWSLDAARSEETSVASLNDAERLGCGTALLLAQELARADAPDCPRLWLVTQGAQATGNGRSPLSVAQSPLWGLGRVIAQEHPNFWGGLVDLDPGASLQKAAAHQLAAEIACSDGEDQLAFRDGQRCVGRLVRQRPSATRASPLKWRADGSYLISGGLGALGLLVARWMVEQGARRLILLGRTKLPSRSNWSSVDTDPRLARQIAAIRELESLGASVHLASIDVADEEELSAFLDDFRIQGWPPIRGVVHAAGVLQDGLLVQLDAAALNTVLRPKVTGGWLLHHLLQDDPLDFFVLFSSAGSVLGQPGQGNYAAANAFLDALAHHRRAQGLPALSVNWGAWAGEGFADSVGGRRLAARLALLGIGSIAPKQALELLGRLLGQGAAQVVAVPIAWKQFREFYPAGGAPPLLSGLAHEEADVSRPAGRTSETRDALLAAGPAERRQLLQSYLGGHVARALGLSLSKLDHQQSLIHLGLDSLMAVELKNRIAVDLKVNVPVAKFLQGFSVDQAVTQVLDQLTAETADPTTPLTGVSAQAEDQQDAKRLLHNLDELSDEQVGALLSEMLGQEKDGARPW